MKPNYVYKAEVARVVDGDTIYFDVDLGFSIRTKKGFRLHGLNTPEISGVKKDSEEYAAGQEAKRFVQEWLAKHGKAGSSGPTVAIRSHKLGRELAQGKYGRYIVEVWTYGDLESDEPEFCLNAELIESGHAEVKHY